MNRRGNILIIVLLMITFVSGIAMLVFERTTKSYMQVMAVQGDNQGGVYSGTAMVAISTLMTMVTTEYDSLDAIWSVIPSIPVKDGFVFISIRAIDSKLSVNALANADEAILERVKDAFSTLFKELGYEDELWKMLHDWVADSGVPQLTNAVADTTFNPQGNSYTAKHSPLSSLPEIRLLPEFSGIYKDLSQYITTGEVIPKININMADAIVIRALLPELEPFIDRIIEERTENPFRNKDALYAILGQGNRDMYNKILPFFDVKSTLFYVRIEVNILDGVQNYHALMQRSGNRMTVLRYIEGGNLDYF